MADKIMMFIDTSKCVGCKACQVACKQWHSLPVGTPDTDHGKAESGDATHLTDTDKSWVTDHWLNSTVVIVADTGTGAVQSRTISANSNNTLTVSLAWDTNPNATSRYIISAPTTSVISTSFTGEYTNPPDYSGNTLTYVKFTEFKRNGKLNWLFFKNQCMHCIRPKCQRVCPRGVERTMDGYIIFNEECTPANVRGPYTSLTEACPFNVPQYNPMLGRYVKCDLCFDRFGSADTTSYRRDSTTGKATTACELTCPSGAILTGTDSYIRQFARDRLKVVKDNPAGIVRGNRYACLYSGNRGRTSVIYLLSERPRSYGLGLR